MVAVALPAPLADELSLVHDKVQSQLTAPRTEPYASAAFAPHISVVYGLVAAREADLAALLHSPERAAPPPKVCLGTLHYWDNPKQHVTSVVVDVEDPSGSLAALHEQLQARLEGPARFAYTPHVTLAFVTLGARLSTSGEAALLSKLKEKCWQPSEIYWTDRCGQHRDHVTWTANP